MLSEQIAMSDDIIGPALPPSFGKSSNDDSDDDTPVGPALPPGYKQRDLSSSSEDSDDGEVVFKRGKYCAKREESTDGPTANKLRRLEGNDKRPNAAEEDDGFFGPALPPGYQKQQSSPERQPLLGPALPPGFRRPIDDEDDDDDDDDDGVRNEGRDSEGLPGPALPPGYRAETSSDGEGDDVIGPLPYKGEVQNSVAMEFERRAQKMKEKLMFGDGPVELARETWMTELPPELQHIGLGARTFKRKSGPESKDRSIWTDTPADRQRKARERLEGKQSDEGKKEIPSVSQKDLKMAEKVSKYNDQKRSESLLSIHSKKMKKRAEEQEDRPVERRPFDRDADLQVNRFDEAQKKSLLKRSQELNTRFSHSKERMFL